jgi:hypothetical protein
MVRATDWDGLSCGPSTAILDPGTAELVVLTPSGLTVQAPETPGTVARVLLPLRTQIVRLYTTDEAIRVLLDADPSSNRLAPRRPRRRSCLRQEIRSCPVRGMRCSCPWRTSRMRSISPVPAPGGRACAWWPSWHREGGVLCVRLIGILSCAVGSLSGRPMMFWAWSPIYGGDTCGIATWSSIMSGPIPWTRRISWPGVSAWRTPHADRGT